MIKSRIQPEITKEIYAYFRKKNTEEQLKHVRSGKLSASKLGKPLLEQMLYVLGVPPKPFDDYTLGQFRRGKDTELAILEALAPDNEQVEVKYKGAIGIIDAVRNEMPYEVKSVKNSGVKYIDPDHRAYTGVKLGNALQAAFGGLALKKDYVVLLYVAADDLRTFPHILKTADLKPEIDSIITKFNDQMSSGELPKWEPVEAWQENPKYSDYPDWMGLDPETAMEKLKTQFTDAFKKLTKKEA